MNTWTLRSLFGMGGERNTVKINRLRRNRDKQWRKRRAARDQFNPESLEQRAMMAVVAPAYEVSQDWGSGFQAEIELQNLDVEAVNDWTISFDYGADITSIWDATIVAREGDRYTIANAGWNADLEAGRSVAFGFIGSADVSGTNVSAPVNYSVNGDPIDDVGGTPAPGPAEPSPTDPVAINPGPTAPDPADPVALPGEYNTVFNVISDWGSGFTGEVAVQNLGSETLKGWEASFDFAGDIDSIWNGQIVNQSGSRYTVRGALWNPDVSPGGTVTFGFNGTPGGSQAVLENFAVMGIHDAPQPISPSPTQPTPLPMPAPTPVADPVDGQGNVFTISPSSPDIVGFNPSTDRLEFGDVSVHNLIIGKTESGEVAIVNPWAWSPEYQVVSGVAFSDLTTENFGVIVNEHLRQDIGGVLSWELGVGPRDANTVYVRSHEYGVQERIENFDPATTKLSFLYFGTRERLSVDDTEEGLLISVEPTGQSVLLVGVAKSDLVPGNIEFHHDQIVEDQLEVPFGYTVEQVSMVSRSALVTPEAPAGELTDGFQTSPGSIAPHDGHDHSDHDHGTMPMPTDPVVSDPVTDPVVPVMPPMDGHDGHDDMPMDDHDGHDHMAPPAASGEFIDITAYGTFHDSNNNSHNHELVGGRTAITTEAMDAYNNLRAFLGLSALTIDDVGEWAFAEQLTNNAQPYGNDIQSVGLWYAMQGAKVGWIAQDKYDPQILADIQRTARLGDPADVMTMVREFGISGYADYLEQYGIADTFISTLKMEPHYGGVMHGRTHGYLSIEGVAINHDVNHLTVLSWDQSQPFMNDTFDWPQWPALDVSDAGVMEYYQSMVVLGDPVGLNMESVSSPVAPPVVPTDPVVTDPVVTDPVVTDPSASPIASHDKVLAAYFPEWGIYGRDYQLADVPADELTHLIYAFADLNAAGEMTLFDSYAATEKRFSAEESVTGEADQWYYPPEDPRSEQTIWGNFNQLALLKEANPHLTISIAVGGWTLSDHFSTVTSTQAGRDTFSDSIVEFLTTYQVFDGIDF
ncbi:MAG: cellulose binding domain-containing protein, partial [Pirellulales bacterium]|nr:cellulose binding domain-containing protein [Pirellulales bacterium]